MNLYIQTLSTIKNTAEDTNMNGAILINALNVLQNTKDSMPLVIKHIKSTTFFKLPRLMYRILPCLQILSYLILDKFI